MSPATDLDRIAAEFAWEMAKHRSLDQDTPPRHRCAHPDAIPVESAVTGETLAALCPTCDTQLAADFLGCPHDDTIDITALDEPPGRQLCQRCGTSGWYGDRTVPTWAELITWL